MNDLRMKYRGPWRTVAGSRLPTDPNALKLWVVPVEPVRTLTVTDEGDGYGVIEEPMPPGTYQIVKVSDE